MSLLSSSMRHVFRLFPVLLLVSALSLASGPVFDRGTASAGDGTVGISGDMGTPPHGHDHGTGDSGEGHHCMTASCTSSFMIEGSRTALLHSRLPSEFLMPLEEGHLGSAYLDSDPPVPRFSA